MPATTVVCDPLSVGTLFTLAGPAAWNPCLLRFVLPHHGLHSYAGLKLISITNTVTVYHKRFNVCNYLGFTITMVKTIVFVSIIIIIIFSLQTKSIGQT